MSLKFLLINPAVKDDKRMYAFTTIPLGITALASAISEFTSYDLLVYDMQLEKNDEDELFKIIDAYKPDVIGYSMNSHQFFYGSVLRKLISERYKALHVAGGVHPSAEPEMVLRQGFDCVVLGEGELTLIELLNSIENDGDKKIARGIAYLRNGRIVINPPRQRITDLDKFRPDFKNIEFSEYSQFATMTSRGCVFGCKFCASEAIWRRNVTYRSIGQVVEEISFASDNNKRCGVIVDDNFNLDKKRFNDFCKKMIERNIVFNWSMNSRVDLINNTDFSLAKKAGCSVVSYGFEAGSKKILSQVNKTIKIEDMICAVNKPREQGIKVKTNWIVGLPGGDFYEQLKSIEIMKTTQPDVISVHTFVPLPGTPFWHHPEKYGIHFDKEKLLEGLNYNVYPLPIKLDYLSIKEAKMVMEKMTETMLGLGYKLSENAGPNDKFIHTPLLKSPKRGQI